MYAGSPALSVSTTWVALVAVTVRVVELPVVIDVGLAEIVTDGGAGGVELLEDPPQLARTMVKAKSRAEKLARPRKHPAMKFPNVVKPPILIVERIVI